MKRIEVFSNHGSFMISEHGFIFERTFAEGTDEDDRNFIKSIAFFNMEEYKNTYQGEELPLSIDILDIGYSLRDGSYENPEESWREMHRIKPMEIRNAISELEHSKKPPSPDTILCIKEMATKYPGAVAMVIYASNAYSEIDAGDSVAVKALQKLMHWHYKKID